MISAQQKSRTRQRSFETVPSLRLRQKAISLAQTDDGLFKVNDVLKFTVYMLTVYKHSWNLRFVEAGKR